MKKTFLIIIGILLSIKVSAQSAEEFLNSVIEKNKSYEDISIIFEYRYDNTESDIHGRTKGYAYLKGDSYLLKFNGQELISDGTTLWTYLIDDQEVMISEISEENNNSPLAIIESFSKDVKVSFSHISNADYCCLSIEENENQNFKTITLIVNIENLKIDSITVCTLDGSILNYKIESFHTNQNLPDSMFIFDEKIHPNVEVIDMR